MGCELRLRLVDERLADAGDADIVLIEHLALVGVARDVGQHLAILLQHVPVPFFQRGAIEEAPDLARQAGGLAHAPEEHDAVLLVDRRGVADDAEWAARSSRGRVGDVEPAEWCRRLRHHLGPVEVFTLLLNARDDEAGRVALDAHLVLLGTEREREGVGVQVAAVHGVGEVIERVAVIARPRRDAQDPGPFRTGELFRQLERRRLALRGAREIDEDGVVRFRHRKALDRAAAFERAVGHRRDPHHRARSVEGDAVVAAGDVVAQHLATREPRAAVGAVIFQALQRALAVAPQHQVTAERLDRVRVVGLHLHRLRDRIPLIEQPAVDQVVDTLLVVRHRRRPCCLSSLVEKRYLMKSLL